MTTLKDLVTTREGVITVSNGDLHIVVWRDRNGRQVFYKCEPMDAEELVNLLPEPVATFNRDSALKKS